MTSKKSRGVLPRLAVAAALAGWMTSPIAAQESTYFFQIDRQELSEALREYARVAGEQIMFTEAVVSSTAPVYLHGSYTAEQALDILLLGTDLTVERSASGVLMVRRSMLRPIANTQVAQTTMLPVPAASAATAEVATQAVGAQQNLHEVMVTGSRIVRDGFEAPTPLTVIGQDAIEAAAPENLADFVNEMPSLVGSATPQNSNLSFSNGQAGINALNLRGLGTVRTLVLLDGRRSVGSAITGIVDVNDLPQGLVSRVEVVTGGASAAYGSDAMSGVVNFILDRKFTGLKGELSGGATTYGDDENWKITLTGGTSFADGRGHVVMSGEYSDRSGIYGVPRSWNDKGWLVMTNPAYQAGSGLPERLVVSGAGLSTATLGGIITNTSLRGIEFGPGGVPRNFNYGQLVRDPYMQGGDWRTTQVNNYNTLDQNTLRKSLFTRASYALNDNVEIFGQVSRSESTTRSWQLKQFNVANIVVRAGNPFIPDSIAQVMADDGIPEFRLGSMNNDIPVISFSGERAVTRYMAGLEGSFDLLGSSWNWDVYYQKGITESSETGFDISRKDRFAAALDAVPHPVTGVPVCRETLTNSASNCVPYNPMGLGVNSQAVMDYMLGSPHRKQRFTQDVAAATFSGEPFSLWAGPVSLAAGVEHRREKVTGSADEVSLQNGWFAGNYLPTFGSYKVTEAFVETVIPLAKDLPFAQAFDLNAAVRRTDYSISGLVTTWKIGATWQPIDDVRFRATRSRDIRAPNLNDLFASGTANTNNVLDPFNGNANTSYQGKAVGNLGLTPEKADTLGLGVVLQPRFLPGFVASFDYYDIEINDAIGNVNAQTIVNDCYLGNQEYCNAITRGPGPGGTSVITQIRLSPFNLVSLRARGYDIETSYRFNAGDLVDSWYGDLTLRMLATRYLENYQDNGINPPTDTAGSNATNGPPDWVYRASLTYSTDALSMTLTGRGVSSGTYDNSFIECSTDCPDSTVTNPTIDNNHIKGALYLDASASYKFDWRAMQMETFVNVSNLTNKDPEVVAQGPSGLAYATIPANPTLYDILGRVYRVGLRARF